LSSKASLTFLFAFEFVFVMEFVDEEVERGTGEGEDI